MENQITIREAVTETMLLPSGSSCTPITSGIFSQTPTRKIWNISLVKRIVTT